jgi:transcriptional regulator with XRE-family HTH domain
MGTNFNGSLDTAPQTEVVVCLNTLATGTEAREVLRCPQCQLVQYRTHNNICRRCHESLDAPPPLAAAPLRPVFAEDEPGLETAEATGTLVPHVAYAIRQWRQRRGLSQRQLAERMHVPRTYVSKIENDKATPTLSSLDRMATAMEINLAALLSEPEPATSEEAFVEALRPYVGRLSPSHRQRLLTASRHLAGR